MYGYNVFSIHGYLYWFHWVDVLNQFVLLRENPHYLAKFENLLQSIFMSFFVFLSFFSWFLQVCWPWGNCQSWRSICRYKFKQFFPNSLVNSCVHISLSYKDIILKLTWHIHVIKIVIFRNRIMKFYGMSTQPVINYNNGPNGHLFYIGGNLMMRRGMLPIIMLPDGDLRIVLHLVPFWILTIWGSVHIQETVLWWRNQLRMKTSAT